MAKFLTVTELAQRTTGIIRELETSGEEVIITKRGKPVAVIRTFSEHDFSLKGGDERGKD
jgi:prevent-host-death family protein